MCWAGVASRLWFLCLTLQIGIHRHMAWTTQSEIGWYWMSSHQCLGIQWQDSCLVHMFKSRQWKSALLEFLELILSQQLQVVVSPGWDWEQQVFFSTFVNSKTCAIFHYNIDSRGIIDNLVDHQHKVILRLKSSHLIMAPHQPLLSALLFFIFVHPDVFPSLCDVAASCSSSFLLPLNFALQCFQQAL